jgi:hypothetical protein
MDNEGANLSAGALAEPVHIFISYKHSPDDESVKNALVYPLGC